MPKIIENVREQLLCEAKRQIAERGYANTTIRSVAGECSLAVGTVYNYFKSKDMLVASFMIEDWFECLAKIESQSTQDARVRLRSIYDGIGEFASKYQSIFQDQSAAKSFLSAFNERHKQLRAQLSRLILPICEAENAVFACEFAAEALLTWTMAGEDFEKIAPLLMKILK